MSVRTLALLLLLVPLLSLLPCRAQAIDRVLASESESELDESGDEGTASTDEDEELPFYIPSQAKLQFAGNVGMLAVGGGWSWWKRRIDLDLLLGWVPPLDGTEPIYIGTLKLTAWPIDLDLGKDWRLRPISLGGTTSLTFGEHYFIFQPDRYPENYYQFSTAVRFGAFLGGSIGHRFHRAAFKGIDFYWEVGFTEFEFWLVVKNPHALAFYDIVHVALGLAVSF